MNDRDFWSCLHDGSIDHAGGVVPGDVVIGVSIPYLRKRFETAGAGFVIVLKGCERFEFTSYDEAPFCRDPSLIAAMDLEISALEEDAECVVVGCTTGALRLEYATAEITLDTGEPVTPEQLEAATQGYWDEWSKRT